MKIVISVTALLAGCLLILLPRYILPVCEFEGYSHMHCSDTAQAEAIIGALFLALGGASFFVKRPGGTVALTTASFILFAVSYWIPDKIGYCMSPRMPCNYGSVPGIRFLDLTGMLIMTVAFTILMKRIRKGAA